MPVYEYEVGGSTVLLHRPVERRDDPVMIGDQLATRRTIPSRLTVGVGARQPTMSDKTWKGYRDLELAGKLNDHPGYMPAAKVKEALLAPEFD